RTSADHPRSLDSGHQCRLTFPFRGRRSSQLHHPCYALVCRPGIAPWHDQRLGAPPLPRSPRNVEECLGHPSAGHVCSSSAQSILFSPCLKHDGRIPRPKRTRPLPRKISAKPGGSSSAAKYVHGSRKHHSKTNVAPILPHSSRKDGRTPHSPREFRDPLCTPVSFVVDLHCPIVNRKSPPAKL